MVSEDRTRVLELDEDLDAAGAARARPHLLRALESGVSGLVVDLGGVSMIDSAGFALLNTAATRASLRRVHWALVVPGERLRRTMMGLGLHLLHAIFPSREEALEHLRRLRAII